jgi:hypothetical protein
MENNPFMFETTDQKSLPSGYLTVRHGKSPSINGPFPMAMLNSQRVVPLSPSCVSALQAAVDGGTAGWGRSTRVVP